MKTTMKMCVGMVLCLFVVCSLSSAGTAPVVAATKLIHINGTFDGSGRFVFNRTSVQYMHKFFGQPQSVTFDGVAWNYSQTPAGWRDTTNLYDVTRARIYSRSGRDAVALELTADGFDLYVCDSPNGAGVYDVVISVPRR